MHAIVPDILPIIIKWKLNYIFLFHIFVQMVNIIQLPQQLDKKITGKF